MFPKVYKLKFNRLAGYHFSAGLRTDTTARINAQMLKCFNASMLQCFNASMPVEDAVEHGATLLILCRNLV